MLTDVQTELLSSDDAAYSHDQYLAEIESGDRRENGARKLNELKPIHLDMIEMHLRGYKNKDIADAFSVTDSTISLLLSDPLAEQIIKEARKESDMRMSALYSKAVDVLDDAMDGTNGISDRLKGASTYFNEANKKGTDQAETAEDIVAKIMNLQLNVSVNVGGGE